MTAAQKQKANNLRSDYAGYIGGRVAARVATDDEVLELCRLNDEYATHANWATTAEALAERTRGQSNHFKAEFDALVATIEARAEEPAPAPTP